MWNFEIIDRIPDLARSSHVFFHPTMIEAWLKTYIPLRKLTPIYIKATQGESTLFLPLVLWTKNWKNAFVRSIVAIGYSDFDYHNPIILGAEPDNKSISAFWEELIFFLKSKYKFDSFIFDGITDVMAIGEGWKRGEICPQLNLKDISNEDELMKFFKTSLRGDLRRQMRRLEEIGQLQFKEYNSWEEIPSETFKEFMRQHSLRWPKAYKAPHFHENLLREGLKSGVVHFSTLSVGDKEIAWHLGFSYRKRFYYYMPAGNQDYLKYSPTKVHLFYLIRRAVEQGYDVFDHLRGEENYKSGWSNGHIYVNNLISSNMSIRTIIADNAQKVKRLIPPPDNSLILTALRCVA